MDYKTFNQIVKNASQKVLAGAGEYEIKDYFVEEGLNVTDFQVADFIVRSK